MTIFKGEAIYRILEMRIILAYMIIFVSIVLLEPLATAAPVNASFCIFNCAAEDLKNRLQANVDCFQNQIMIGVPGRTAYGTEDLSSDGKEVLVSGEWLTEDELRKDWKENPDSHSSNCYFIADITPQEVERVYQESLK